MRCAKSHVLEITPPVPPVFSLINGKVWNVHVVSLPGALVIGQIPPFHQVVVVPLLVHAESKGARTTVSLVPATESVLRLKRQRFSVENRNIVPYLEIKHFFLTIVKAES